ncbi:MAG TPA: hypothetical protein VGT03_00870, partial [Candidatus Acidoferrales bacterium]|nr:hypothetical protein [Candidatus Acidoferrales bacterium]
SVVIIDGYSFAATQPGPVGQLIGVNRLNDNWWAPGVFSGTVPVYDGNTNALITTVTTGFCPLEAHFDIKYNRVWVGDQCGSFNDPVFAFNAKTYALQAGPIGTGGVFGGAQVNSANGILYAGGATCERVDPVTFVISPVTVLPACPLGGSGTIDSVHNLIYGVYGTSPNFFLYIASGGTRTTTEKVLHTISLTFQPGGVAVNTALNHLYIGNASSVSIDVRGSSGGANITNFSLGSSALGIDEFAVDSIRGRIYALVNTAGGLAIYVIEDLLPATKVSPGY